jgi:hypothetical protein
LNCKHSVFSTELFASIVNGLTVTRGGGFRGEEFIPPICSTGTNAGCSYPDISALYGNRRVFVQTVDVTATGVPTQRELDNIARIQSQVADAIVIAVPKGATAMQIDTAITEALQ